jgi:Mg2+/Co2+ transporter CorB
MSFSRRAESQVRYIAQAFNSFSLPAWTNSITLRIAILGLLLVSGFAYITQTSSAAVSGYQIHQLEKQVQLLTSEEQRLSSQVAEYSSLVSIQERLKNVTMTPLAQVQITNASRDAVARK